jgi:hypothetical protein
MALSLQSYAVLPSKVPLCSPSSFTASRLTQHFDANEVRALSSLVARYGGTVLESACASGEVRVRVRPDAQPSCHVIIVHHAHGYKASVQEERAGINEDSGSEPVTGGWQRRACALLCSRPAVRTIVIVSRCDAKESVELVCTSGNCAPVVAVVAVDWLFHCCITSTFRSPLLYAVPPARKPLSPVHATSSGMSHAAALLPPLTRPSGITIAQRELLVPALLSLGASFSPNLDERCTHLIVPSGSSDLQSSPKVAACSQHPLCRYVWIVTSAWLVACQAQRCRVAERAFQPQGVQPPAFPSADAWLASVVRDSQPEYAACKSADVGQNCLMLLPPSALFLDGEVQLSASQSKQAAQQPHQAHLEALVLPSKTRGWWIDESSAAHVTRPLSPPPYLRVAELMSLSSSDMQPSSHDSEQLPSSQLNTPVERLEHDVQLSPPGAKTDSKSPASSMSASRTSQCKRKELRAASDSWIAAAEDLYCAVDCLMDERYAAPACGCRLNTLIYLFFPVQSCAARRPQLQRVPRQVARAGQRLVGTRV